MTPIADIAVVYRVHHEPGFALWRADNDVELSGLDPSGLVLRLDDSPGPLPTFSHIEGVDGAFVVKIDLEGNPGTSSFSHQAGRVYALQGDAGGFSLVVPYKGPLLDTEETVGIEQHTPANWAFHGDLVGEVPFRSTPRLHEMYCGEIEYADDPPITDLDDYYNMAFRIWYQLTNATGLSFEEIWRGPR